MQQSNKQHSGDSADFSTYMLSIRELWPFGVVEATWVWVGTWSVRVVQVLLADWATDGHLHPYWATGWPTWSHSLIWHVHRPTWTRTWAWAWWRPLLLMTWAILVVILMGILRLCSMRHLQKNVQHLTTD